MDLAPLLAQLENAGLDRDVDLPSVGLGARGTAWVLNALAAVHRHIMAGDISALKGVQGARGYPS
jgi:hypothetical protein